MTLRHPLSAALLCSIVALALGPTRAATDSDDEDSRTYRCGDAKLALEIEEKAEGSVLRQACLARGGSRTCTSLDVPFLTTSNILIECRGADVEISLPQSVNYPVFTTVRLSYSGSTLRLARVYDSGVPPDARDYTSARQLIRAGKFDSGFDAWISSHEDPRCMNMGCRPSEQTTLLALGDEVAAQARASARSGRLDTALAMFEAYFTYLAAKAVVADGTPAGAAAALVKGELSELVPLLNDYAYYLSERKEYARARPLLDAVIKSEPRRWVAHLNLADVLWALADEGEARRHYALYARNIPSAKWPKRLRDRCGADCTAR